ncbi:DUF983 domain-containing protein [Altererythrobacter sp. CC-YST694]|uniref:DUF983 domain-containing protein n=1 Tax=Altererythrobacter sp. CC-YST694 TaxID=2755038 RepID=UPI001D02EAAB|nr:DUF983 domain-containing protein [Altererythrobacter sp. CC-YST694]MCB5424004.1 DUF983 domain-containing protein [Altererythrobacter sp. CC-YST694]
MNQPKANKEGQPAAVQAALLGLCPRCGAKCLFEGLARFAPCCKQCGLDFAQFNVGDGPAAFLTLIIGALVVILALWLEFSVHPPLWVHALIWMPIIAGSTIWGLRVSKAWLLQAEYWRKAKEVTGGDVGGETEADEAGRP